MAPAAAPAQQRLDKWLCFARVVKTRTLAAKLVASGYVRVNGARIVDPSKRVGPGDVLTVSLERDVRVLQIRSCGDRRGPYSEARTLYSDLAASGEERASRPPEPEEF